MAAANVYERVEVIYTRPTWPTLQLFFVSKENSPPFALNYAERDFIIARFRYRGSWLEQAFYRSSGANSDMPDTWLPCDGVTALISARDWKARKYLHEWVEKSRFTKKLEHEELARFGTCALMKISKLIGGGVWEHPGKSNRLREACQRYSKDRFFLKKNFESYNIAIGPGLKVDSQTINTFIGTAISANYTDVMPVGGADKSVYARDRQKTRELVDLRKCLVLYNSSRFLLPPEFARGDFPCTGKWGDPKKVNLERIYNALKFEPGEFAPDTSEN